MRKAVLFILLFASLHAWAQPEIKPYGALPSSAQVKWQQLEYYMFIHFGPNTFTDKEWGHGDEDPKVFNPTALDARQWARTAKLAGMKGIIITAKHHDGFCLWPSEYSKHTVRESAWKNGKGDVLAELSAACREYGLLFGVYLSPWDRNHPAYGTPEYNQVFANQLREVHTKYGHVFEQWFDGANGEGPNGKKQVYDWNLFESTVKKYHPEVIFFSDAGPGCRWIGNENGFAGTTNWSTINRSEFAPGMHGIQDKLNTGQEGGSDWVPGEADVSIRPGWFYSPSTDDKVKTLHELLNIYYGSVGRNANLLLNVPVDRRGRIHPNDSTRLMELRKALEEDFADNLTKKARIRATNTRSGNAAVSAAHLIDNSYNTYWATEEGKTTGDIIISWEKPVTFNRIELQEFIPLGQRVKSFEVSVYVPGVKKYVRLGSIEEETSTIGYKRILRLTGGTETTSSIKISITDAKASPVISEIKIFNAPARLSDPVISRDIDGHINIKCASPGPRIYFTTDGSEPTTRSQPFHGLTPYAEPVLVKAKAFVNDGRESSATVSAFFGYASRLWKSIPNGAARAFDGNSHTAVTADFPCELAVDISAALPLKGFIYTPGTRGGIVSRYAFYVSNDGKNWGEPAAEGTFDNILNNPVPQRITFKQPVRARYFKFVAKEPADPNEKKASIAEIGVF